MKETRLWTYLKKILPPQGHYSRIESPDTCPGFPDVHYALDGYHGTMELKSTQRPKAMYPFSKRDGLRKSQLVWIRDQTSAGGRVILVLQAVKGIFFLSGELYASDLHYMTLEDLERTSYVHIVKGPSISADARARLYKALTES